MNRPGFSDIAAGFRLEFAAIHDRISLVCIILGDTSTELSKSFTFERILPRILAPLAKRNPLPEASDTVVL